VRISRQAAVFSLLVAFSWSCGSERSTEPGSLAITTTAVPPAVIGSAYSVVLVAAGGVVPYSWQVPVGDLPQGLDFDSSNGRISGVPIESGEFLLHVTVSDASEAEAEILLALNVDQPTGGELTIATEVLSPAMIGAAYTSSLQAIGGAAPYSWSLLEDPPAIAAPDLAQPGFQLETSGEISGTAGYPAGVYRFEVVVTDAENSTATKTVSLPVSAPSGIAVATSELPDGMVEQPYEFDLQASGGVQPYTWSLWTGELGPGGLTLDTDGHIAGTPLAPTSVDTVVVRVVDAVGATAFAWLTLTVQAGALRIVAAQPIPEMVAGNSYEVFFFAENASSRPIWTTSSGALPPGLQFGASWSAGRLFGVPTAPGVFSFTVTAQDSTQSTSLDVSVRVRPVPLVIQTTSLPPGVAGIAYEVFLVADGGTQPHRWSVSAGTLPGGLTLSTDGGLSGIPTTAGTYLFSVKVVDGSPGGFVQAQEQPLTLVINP